MLLLRRNDHAPVPVQPELQECKGMRVYGRHHRLRRGNLRRPAPGHKIIHDTKNKHLNQFVKDIRVDKVIIHPEYEINQIGLAINDVMLVKLSQPVEYNTWVRPVCLPDL